VSQNSRPRIALVSHQINDRGGMERAFFELVKRLHRRYAFTVFAHTLARELRPLVRWERVAVPPRPIPLLLTMFFAAAGRRVARGSFDLVHTLGALVPNRASVATVQYCHAGFRAATGALSSTEAPLTRRANTAVTRGLALAAERWCYRPARLRHFAAVSAGTARELERHYGGIPVSITPNGVDLRKFRPSAVVRRELRTREGLADDDFVALFVGGDWDRKGLGIAIRALSQASPHTRATMRLWVAGQGDINRFRCIAQSVGVDGLVRFFGVRSDVEYLCQAADAFVLPTAYETFSNATYEAAACALPVIAPRVSGIEDLVGDNEAGFLTDRTPEALAEALVPLAGNDELRQRMGKVALERASKFPWERSVDAVDHVYQQLLAESGPRSEN
jgi:UDP-glucose:(heptosyl)LPS alpha-1,3-glucosyltransferase